jgi:hypothetical protein
MKKLLSLTAYIPLLQFPGTQFIMRYFWEARRTKMQVPAHTHNVFSGPNYQPVFHLLSSSFIHIP